MADIIFPEHMAYPREHIRESYSVNGSTMEKKTQSSARVAVISAPNYERYIVGRDSSLAGKRRIAHTAVGNSSE